MFNQKGRNNSEYFNVISYFLPLTGYILALKSTITEEFNLGV